MIARFEHPREAAEWCQAQRALGKAVGFIPTMGALHAGHLTLVERSVAEGLCTCVSVFVNPLQFDESADFERYPRDLAADATKLAEVGCDMVFTGTLADFFPDELDGAGQLPSDQRLDPGPRAAGLEGEYRPGHFAGVATIVDRLFQWVEPERAYFGQKDYQQCLVVQDVAHGRGGTPRIVVCPTVREASGLAMSSRNLLLGEEDKEDALSLSRALRAAAQAWEAGERGAQALAAVMLQVFEASGVRLEYAEVRDPDAWSAERPCEPLSQAVALVAARVGAVRLIDNALLSKAPAGRNGVRQP